MLLLLPFPWQRHLEEIEIDLTLYFLTKTTIVGELWSSRATSPWGRSHPGGDTDTQGTQDQQMDLKINK